MQQVNCDDLRNGKSLFLLAEGSTPAVWIPRFQLSLLTGTDLSPSRLVLPELSNVAVCLLILPHTTHLQNVEMKCNCF